MPNFNLVCHGMMLHCEMQNNCQILIPAIDEHMYLYGDPQPIDAAATDCQPHTADLSPLPVGDFTLEGISLRQTPDSFADHSYDFVVIKNSMVQVNYTMARTAIVVPRPDSIQLFRPVAPKPPKTFLGQTPSEIVANVPERVHDVVVFHYAGLPFGTKLRIGNWYAQELRDEATTLCVWAQTANPPQTGEIPPSTFTPPPAYSRVAHSTGLNDFILISGNYSHPDFQLSAIAKADDPPATPGFGLTRCELKNLYELTPSVTDGSGCAGAAVVFDGYSKGRLHHARVPHPFHS